MKRRPEKMCKYAVNRVVTISTTKQADTIKKVLSAPTTKIEYNTPKTKFNANLWSTNESRNPVTK